MISMVLADSASSPLPIIGARIPIVLFYVVSPFILRGAPLKQSSLWYAKAYLLPLCSTHIYVVPTSEGGPSSSLTFRKPTSEKLICERPVPGIMQKAHRKEPAEVRR
jgi:hypothetical protein